MLQLRREQCNENKEQKGAECIGIHHVDYYRRRGVDGDDSIYNTFNERAPKTGAERIGLLPTGVTH